MTKPLLQIVIASTRPGRAGLPVAEWITARAIAHDGFDVEVVDLAEVNLPFLDEPHHPRLGQYVHQHTRDWSAVINRADAFVFVTPEYNFSYNAVLKNAIDYLHNEWHYKCVGFVSYGGVSAGTRSVQALKQVLSALKMTPVYEAVNIPFVRLLIDEQNQLMPNEIMGAAATDMLDELLRCTAALSGLREAARGSTR